MRLVFWQNIVSHLQVPYIRELARLVTGDVTLCVPQVLTAERESLGWSATDCSPAKLVVGPDEKTIGAIVGESATDSWHIFSGIRAYPFVWQAFRATMRATTRRAIVSETAKYRGIKGLFRVWRAQIERVVYQDRYVDRIFAIGSPAAKWFRLAGFPSRKIVPFAYFTDKPSEALVSVSQDHRFEFIFIGQCIRRKGVDILLRALSQIRSPYWRLRVMGSGADLDSFKALANLLGLGEKVQFLGAVDNSRAMTALQGGDLLVLPSRWDGWGAVVNEALLRGVPAVCSSRCGAADLLRNGANGLVFESGSAEALAKALEKCMSRGKPALTTRNEIRNWAKSIHPETGARYMLQSLRTPEGRVPAAAPPWLADKTSATVCA